MTKRLTQQKRMEFVMSAFRFRVLRKDQNSIISFAEATYRY